MRRYVIFALSIGLLSSMLAVGQGVEILREGAEQPAAASTWTAVTCPHCGQAGGLSHITFVDGLGGGRPAIDASTATALDMSHSNFPPDVREIVAAHEQRVAEIRARAEEKVSKESQKLISQLRPLQDKYTREGRLDEAVAIRDYIRALEAQTTVHTDDPGTMSAYSAQVGRSMVFKIVGTTSGSIYGTDVYTTDSSIAAAAVHAGILRDGETGLVRVTVLPGLGSYAASTRHGVASHAWGQYSSSFRLDRVRKRDR